MNTKKKILTGKVIAPGKNKTVSVLVEEFKMHRLYKKRVKNSKKYLISDDSGNLGAGDIIEIKECPPVSKKKRFEFHKIVKKKLHG